MPLALVILSSIIAVTAIVLGIRRTQGSFRWTRVLNHSAIVAATLFPIWVWPCSVACILLTGAMRGTCVPDTKFHGVVALVLMPSLAWIPLQGMAFRSRPMLLAPLVGAAFAIGINTLLDDRSKNLDDAKFMTFGWMTIAWIVPQVLLGIMLLKPATKPGHCLRCNYDRTGISMTTPCPECGL